MFVFIHLVPEVKVVRWDRIRIGGKIKRVLSSGINVAIIPFDAPSSSHEPGLIDSHLFLPGEDGNCPTSCTNLGTKDQLNKKTGNRMKARHWKEAGSFKPRELGQPRICIMHLYICIPIYI